MGGKTSYSSPFDLSSFIQTATPLQVLLERQCELAYYGKSGFPFNGIEDMDSKEFVFAYSWVTNQMQETQRVYEEN